MLSINPGTKWLLFLFCRHSNDLDSVFCQSYQVTSGGEPASIFLTNGPAKIDPNVRQILEFQNTGLNALEEFDYRALHLLPSKNGCFFFLCNHSDLKNSTFTGMDCFQLAS